jgi:hypothetical protein
MELTGSALLSSRKVLCLGVYLFSPCAVFVTPLQDNEAPRFLREWSEINMGAEMTAESLQYVLIRT